MKKKANPGDLVEVRWDPTSKKRAQLVRWNRAGNPVVRVERVDAKGKPTGEFGSERVFMPDDILRVLKS